MILGNADPNGNANAQIIHQWNDKLRTRILAQVWPVLLSVIEPKVWFLGAII